MLFDKVLKDHNSDSPESTLKVRYIANYGNSKSQKSIKLNPYLNEMNILPKIKYKVNDLRKEQFNSYTNENMDFFRLDHLCECDRDNYHNKFMDKVVPINRSENFQKFNELGKNIKYLDYLKENTLLNQNRIINRNIISERDLEIAKKREKYYSNKAPNYQNDLGDKNNIESYNYKNNNDNNRYFNQGNNSYNFYDNINNNNPYNRPINKSNSTISISGNYLNKFNKNYNNDYDNHFENKRNQSYSNLYLSNINNYSIKEGDKNYFEESTKFKLYPTFPREPLNKDKIKSLYNQDSYRTLINNNPFYIAYNENSKNLGFLKKIGDFSNYEKIYKNRFFFRNKSTDVFSDRVNKKMHNFNSHFNNFKNQVYNQ